MPSTEHEVQQYISTCVGLTAKQKGVANAGFYDVAELLAFLRANHPETHTLLVNYINIYGGWAYSDRKLAEANEGKPADRRIRSPQLEQLAKQRDDARKALLSDLGLV